MKTVFEENEELLAESQYPNEEDYDDGVDDIDDDIDDESLDDDIDWETEEAEALRKKSTSNTMNYNQSVFQPANPWSPAVTPTATTGTQYSPWGQSVTPGVTSPWGSTTTPRWSPTPSVTPGVASPWSPSVATTPPGAAPGANQWVIDRKKRVVITDLQDCLIGSMDSGGRLGVPPRGIYDIYVRRDVVDKIRCFGPQWIYVLTNSGPETGTEAELRFCRMADYVCACVSDLVGLPVGNVRCLMSSGLNPYDPCTKPGTGLLEVAYRELKGHHLKKSDLVVIGSQSGYTGQSGKDAQMAAAFGVDYIDVQQLITYYK